MLTVGCYQYAISTTTFFLLLVATLPWPSTTTPIHSPVLTLNPSTNSTASSTTPSCLYSYHSRIPNSEVVPHPCYHSTTWYQTCGDGGKICVGDTTFDSDFALSGHRWTEELCMMDSDGDGRTNGQELGDPDCVWREGEMTNTTAPATVVSHPGYCEALGCSDAMLPSSCVGMCNYSTLHDQLLQRSYVLMSGLCEVTPIARCPQICWCYFRDVFLDPCFWNLQLMDHSWMSRMVRWLVTVGERCSPYKHNTTTITCTRHQPPATTEIEASDDVTVITVAMTTSPCHVPGHGHPPHIAGPISSSVGSYHTVHACCVALLLLTVGICMV